MAKASALTRLDKKTRTTERGRITVAVRSNDETDDIIVDVEIRMLCMVYDKVGMRRRRDDMVGDDLEAKTR